MKEIEFDELLKIAEGFYKNKIPWHFHILTPKCIFNKAKNKFCIILENETSGDVFVTLYDEKPLKDGEKLEALFYGRV
jgi:hypothetical protein